MTDELKTAKRVVIQILSTGTNFDSLHDLYEIRSGNKQLLLQHIQALASIFSVAYADLLKEINDDNKNES